MSQAHLLVVEDEKDISELVALHLRRDGHVVTLVENGEEALTKLSQEKYDLALLDWMLPGVSGLELCKKIRAGLGTNPATLPVVMLTARAHTSDIVLGLEMGADDYVTKPFEIPELLARVHALLRRTQSLGERGENGNLHEVGELRVDASSYQVTCGKKEVQLTPSEFRLLLSLVKNRGRVLTRERLIDLVQGEGVNVVDRTIDTHIFGLRKKLGKCADIVETIRGVGYRVKSE